jgi:hypothetical protein
VYFRTSCPPSTLTTTTIITTTTTTTTTNTAATTTTNNNNNYYYYQHYHRISHFSSSAEKHSPILGCVIIIFAIEKLFNAFLKKSFKNDCFIAKT